VWQGCHAEAVFADRLLAEELELLRNTVDPELARLGGIEPGETTAVDDDLAAVWKL
jgi:hypothetical protein